MKIISRQQAKEKKLNRYFTGKPCKYGHLSEREVANCTCVQCKSNADKERYRLNSDDKKQARANNYWANPEKHREWHRNYYSNNKEKRIAVKNLWRKKNPVHVRKKSVEYEATRRAKINNAGGRFSAKDVEDKIKNQRNKCATCEKKITNIRHEVDHIVPISKGGDNSKYNIQILCRSCNRKKGSRCPIEWAQQNGKLL